MPAHWEKALRKNGQMAVDIIMCVQKWHIEPGSVPDTRHGSMASMVDEAELNGELKLDQPSESGVNGGYGRRGGRDRGRGGANAATVIIFVTSLWVLCLICICRFSSDSDGFVHSSMSSYCFR